MSSSTHSEAAAVGQLCPACGLCCNGVIFANVGLRPGDDAARLRAQGLPVCTPPSKLRPQHLSQPCAAFDGCHCRVYADRPQYCREFECALLKSVTVGHTTPAAGLRIIRTAREQVERVRRLLFALGDTDEQIPLNVRFRRTGKRLKEREVDEKTAAAYGRLTLAVHDLNLLLSDAFYPGSASHRPKWGALQTGMALVCAGLLLFATADQLRADQIEMRNGDRYAGNVLSLSTNAVVLHSAVLGTVRLPRSQVAVITLGPTPAANSPALHLPAPASLPTAVAAPANVASNPAPALRGMSMSTNLIQQVQKQFLSGAGTEANAKFNELLGGLMSGKLSVDDIRAEAKTAADQLRALQRESGEDTGIATGAYLAILDHFLKETAPSNSSTITPAQSQQPKAEAGQD